MIITDTHSHLYDGAFDADRNDVLDRARAAGIERIFLPNISADTVEPMMMLVRQHPGFLYPMIGLHPEDMGTTWRSVLPRMEELLQQPDHPFIAVGEVGLDYYWDRSLYDEQQEAFAIQVGWAQKYNLPLAIHSRSAHRELVNVMKQQMANSKSSDSTSSNSKLSGVFHCFSGSREVAEELLTTFPDFMLGIGGVVTYKNSKLPEVLRSVVPLDHIVVETDAPYLSPVPYRGKRNETAYIVEVVRVLADIYGATPDEIAEKTTENALKTFPKCQ